MLREYPTRLNINSLQNDNLFMPGRFEMPLEAGGTEAARGASWGRNKLEPHDIRIRSLAWFFSPMKSTGIFRCRDGTGFCYTAGSDGWHSSGTATRIVVPCLGLESIAKVP